MAGLARWATSHEESRHSVDEPFLPKPDGIAPTVRHERGIKRLKLLVMALAIVIFTLGVTCIALVVRLSSMVPVYRDEVYSPAKDVVVPKNIVFTSGFGGGRTEYQGPPTPERNALWDDLYSFGVSRISRESAAQLVNRTVPLPGKKGGYVVQLNVFHQLHCLNMLRKRLYSKEEYPPDHELMGIEHLEHCYDALRQSLMCSADITPLTWKWSEKAHEAKEVAEVIHTCRDFEAIKAWAKERVVDDFDRSIHVVDDLNP